MLRSRRLVLLRPRQQGASPRAKSLSSHAVFRIPTHTRPSFPAALLHTQAPSSSSTSSLANAPPRPRRGHDADAYAWMEEPGSAEMLAHLDAENHYSYKAMQSTHRLQATLFREMYAYLRPTSDQAEAGKEEEDALHLAEAGGDGYVYYSRRPRGCNFPIYYRRRQQASAAAAAAAASPAAVAAAAVSSNTPSPVEGTEQILLNQNAMPDFYQRQHLGDLKVSPPNDDYCKSSGSSSSSSSSSSSNLVAFTLAAPEAMEQGTTLYIQILSSSSSSSSSPSAWWTADKGAWQGIGSFEWGPISSEDKDKNQPTKSMATRVLYYTKVDSNGRPHQVWMVRLKTKGQGIHNAPRLLYSLPIKDEAFFLSLSTTKDKKFVTFSSNSKTASEVHLLPGPALKEKEGEREGGFEPVLFKRRKAGVQYFVEHGGDSFWVVTNEQQEAEEGREEGMKDGEYRLVTCPTHDTNQWTPCALREGQGSSSSSSSSSISSSISSSSSSIEDIDLFHDHCVLYERLHGTPSLRVLDRHPTSSSSLPSSHRPLLPPEVETGRIQPGLNQDYFGNAVRFSLTSPILPDVTYEYNMNESVLTELHRETLRARPPTKQQQQHQQQQHQHQHQQGYECHRHWVASNQDDEEVRIPLTLAHNCDLSRPAPVLLLAYGAYGVTLDLSFRPEILPLLDRGWVIAYAHVRGGGELGRQWHAQGNGAKKMNSIKDYLSCAEWLVEKKWTRPGLLVGQGASAGALVVAGGVHRCPEIFGGMVLKVPFLDLARTMLDASLALTVHEYDEWTEGRDPRRDGGVEGRLRELSPYDSLDLLLPSAGGGGRGGRTLPPTLFLASLADHRVRYWEAAKYAAKAREVSEGGRGGEVLLRMEGDRAHDAPMAQTDILQEAAYEAAFMITRLGLEEKEGEEKGEGEVVEEEGGRGRRRRARRAAHQKPRHLGKVPPLVFW